MPAHATTLADFTLPELMLAGLHSESTGDVVGKLCQAMEWAGRVPDSRAFYDAVMAREKICSTAAPEGWALPHARIQGLKQLSFAVAKPRTALDWLGAEGQPVRVVFLFAVPEGDMTYLRLIAGVARLTMDQPQMKQLAEATQAGAMFEVLRAIPMPPPAGIRAAL